MEWAESRQGSNRNGLAVNVIRKASTVFGGVGVYTVCDLFFRAGEYFFLTVIDQDLEYLYGIQDFLLFSLRLKFLMFHPDLLGSVRRYTPILKHLWYGFF